MSLFLLRQFLSSSFIILIFFSLRIYVHISFISSAPSTPSHVALGGIRRDDPLFPVFLYVDEFIECLAARQFAAIGISGDAWTIRDRRHGRECDTAIGIWRKHWWRWGSSSGSELSSYLHNIESPYVRCYEGAGYERRLSDIGLHIHNIDQVDWVFVLGDVLASARPYDYY